MALHARSDCSRHSGIRELGICRLSGGSLKLELLMMEMVMMVLLSMCRPLNKLFAGFFSRPHNVTNSLQFNNTLCFYSCSVAQSRMQDVVLYLLHCLAEVHGDVIHDYNNNT